MSDLLKSFWEFLKFVWEYLNTLTPLQTLICIAWAGFCVLLVVGAFRMGSSNPKHYSDEYVRTHMSEFDSWFDKHPEDKARYESEPRQFVFIIEDHSSKSDKTSKDSHSPEETPDHSSKKEEEKE